MGLLYIIYKGNISKGFIKGIYKGSVYTTWGTSEGHIRLRPKVHGSILGGLYSKIRDPNSNFNGILSINRRANKKTELDIKTVFTTLCQLYIK